MDRPALPKEDLFEHSTMTFGEHLDELRKALARALTWLGVGTLLALFVVAKPLVRWIQTPLEQAIVQYQADQTSAKFDSQFGDGSERDTARLAALKDFMVANGLSIQQIWAYSGSSPLGEPLSEEQLAAERAAELKARQAAGEKTSDEETDNDSNSKTDDASATPTRIPSPFSFQPTWQLVKTEAGLNSHKLEEPFMIYLKAAVVAGAVLASPGIFYHLWGFVAAGLYPHERKYVYVYLPFSVTLFISGVLLAFFAVMHYVLQFLLDFNSTLSVDMEPRLSYYMTFVLLLPLGFGIAFQLPLVMLFLQRIGIIETSAYEKSWRIAVLVIAIVSMVFTPADPYSMILLMVPLVILYFLGIGLCRFMPRGRGLGSEAYDPS